MAQVEWKEMCPDTRAMIVAPSDDIKCCCRGRPNCFLDQGVSWWLMLEKDRLILSSYTVPPSSQSLRITFYSAETICSVVEWKKTILEICDGLFSSV